MSRFVKILFGLSLVANVGVVYVAFKALEYRGHINFFLDKYINVVKEFSNRDIWEKDNATVGPSTPGRPRVIFMGTQVTSRWNVAKSFPEYEAIDRSVRHQRVSGFLLRIVPDVIELKPEAVVFEVSSYNLRPESSIKELTDYVASLADLAASHRIVPILTTLVPPRRGSTGLGDYDLHDSLKVYNAWIRKYSDSLGYPLGDLTMALSDDEGYLPDSLSHDMIDPNDAGLAKMTAAVELALRKLRRKTD